MEQNIYKHSDFKLRETLPADMAGVPFSFDYFVVKNGKRYTASYDGAQYVNCANDNGVIVVCFDAPCFECGKLKAERRFTLQDDHFTDKSYNPVGLYELGIRITNDPTHIPGGDVSTEIAPSWAVGPAGPQGLPGKDGKDGAPGAPGATGADGAPGKIQRLVVNGQAVEADEAGTATFNVESTGGAGLTPEQSTLLGTAEQLETTAKTLPTAVNELKAENANLGRELGQNRTGVSGNGTSELANLGKIMTDASKSFTIICYAQLDSTPYGSNAIIGNTELAWGSGRIFYSNASDTMFVRIFGTELSIVYRGSRTIPHSYILSWDAPSRTASFYLNGESTTKTIDNPVTNDSDYFFGKSMSDSGAIVFNKNIIYSYRKINSALSQSEIDMLYNQGRCLDVVLGDEWRKELIVTPIIGTYWTEYSVNGNNKRYTASRDGICGITFNIAGHNLKNASVKFRIKTNVDKLLIRDFNAGSIYPIYINLIANEWTDVCFTIMNSDTQPIIRNVYVVAENAINSDTYIEFVGDGFIEVKQCNVLDEFTPKSLTPTKWLNTGINATPIELTNPVFTSEQPIKERQWLLSTGTKPIPAAMGQELYTTDNGLIYKCKAKPNTRQFTVADWKEI